jgi:Tol biopolymer transport system component
MGEVYKARDTRLNRIVALKVMAAGDTNRTELTRRFAAEARAIAALNHTHICAVYDTGRHAGRDFLVLEYLDGETLAQRLERGALSRRELLQYAIEMAEALDFAHRHGVVHRDLKPSNVFLCRSAGVKLLDFGLARVHAAASGPDPPGDLATEPLEITTDGAIVGTLNYLAPERLDGHSADARSDIFAYGAVLYEMVTRRRAYPEQTQARVIAAILSGDPPNLDQSPDTPAALEWIVRYCLTRDPDDRWQSMGDVARVLKNIPGTTTLVAPGAVGTRPWTWRMVAALAIVAALAGVAAWLTRASWSQPDIVSAPTIFSIPPPAGQAFALTGSTIRAAQFAMSPDGRTLAFVARAGGIQQLWIQKFNQAEPRALPETAGASLPFWSPDSRFLGFFANESLKKVNLVGRSPTTLCKAPIGRGGAWHEDGTIVFSPDNSTGLYRVSDAGGTPTPLTARGDAHFSHRWPQVLPDGGVLFFIRSADPEVEGIYYTSLSRAHDLRRIRSNPSSGVYTSGMLLYVLDGTLVAQPLDSRTGTLAGEATPVGLKASVSSALNPALSVSAHGTLATWSGVTLSELVWFDHKGNKLGTAGSPDHYGDFRLSPDEQRLAVSRLDRATNSADVDVLDLQRGGFTPVSSSPQTDGSPIWSPDGRRLVFRSNRRGLHALFERPSDGSGNDVLLYSSGFGIYPTDWSRDDGTILFHLLGRATKHDIWKFTSAPSLAEPLHQTASDEAQAQLGSGGRLAYISNEAGEINVYVRALSKSAASTSVSVEGGSDPRWSGDGRKLFFVSSTGMMMSAEVTSGEPPKVTNPKPLFKTSIQQPTPPYFSSYVVTRDGTRFLINVPTDPPGSAPITVTLNWPALIGNAR